jgi:hypothetical protein
MTKLRQYFKLKRVPTFKGLFTPKEDKTDLNLLLRQLLNDRTIEQSLKLKEELDLRYDEIMKEELNQRILEGNLISNHLKSNGTKN